MSVVLAVIALVLFPGGLFVILGSLALRVRGQEAHGPVPEQGGSPMVPAAR